MLRRVIIESFRVQRGSRGSSIENCKQASKQAHMQASKQVASKHYSRLERTLYEIKLVLQLSVRKKRTQDMNFCPNNVSERLARVLEQLYLNKTVTRLF